MSDVVIVVVNKERRLVNDVSLKQYIEECDILRDALDESGLLTVKHLLSLKQSHVRELINMLRKMDKLLENEKKRFKNITYPEGVAWLKQFGIPILINELK